jgi:hypothetical protein
MGFSRQGLTNYLPGLALNHDPHDLCLLSSWDYRPEPPAPGSHTVLQDRVTCNIQQKPARLTHICSICRMCWALAFISVSSWLPGTESSAVTRFCGCHSCTVLLETCSSTSALSPSFSVCSTSIRVTWTLVTVEPLHLTPSRLSHSSSRQSQICFPQAPCWFQWTSSRMMAEAIIVMISQTTTFSVVLGMGPRALPCLASAHHRATS